jgi:hypothetical protein
MQRFALMRGDAVHEIIEMEEGGPPLAERFHPDLVAQMRPAPAGVQPGWVRVGQGFAPPPPPSRTAAEARAERDARLAACDWTQIPDAPLTAEQRAAWASYRAALRAVPDQPGFPATITWPETPA